MTDQLTHLAPATHAVVLQYLSELEIALAAMRANEREEALHDAEEFFAERLTAESSPADAALVGSELGVPAEFAANMLGALGRRSRRETVPAPSADSDGMGSGIVLGMPYDIRVPTASRVALRWWDPTNPRVFVPRVWGLGWAVNFGAVAVKVGLIRQDDEDEPFGSVPSRAIAIALLIPIALTLSIVALALVFGERLPAQLPSHWNLAGQPDRFWSAAAVLGFNLTMAGVPTAYAAYCVLLGRVRLQQAAAIALALLMSVLGSGIYAQSVLWGLGADVTYASILILVMAFVAPFAELTILARIGRAREWSRELSLASRKEER